MWGSGPQFGPFWASYRCSGPGFKPFWAYFGGSGPIFDPFLGPVEPESLNSPSIGPIFGLFRGFWAYICGVLGLDLANVGPLTGILGLDLGHFWPISGVLNLDLAHFGPISRVLGLYLGHFWPISGCWAWIWPIPILKIHEECLSFVSIPQRSVSQFS